jgi:hypothetical protein
MILQPIPNQVADVLHSADAVALVQVQGQKLKNMILTVRRAGWGLAVIETTADGHFVMFAASAVHQGNLVGDVRRWTKEFGYEFHLKLPDQEWPTPTPDVFVLPDGREIEIGNVLTIGGNFTQWGLASSRTLPEGLVRL